jgi:tRNA (guanine37-N1)-methyltransferase
MTLRVDVLTLFPDMFRGFLDESIVRRAIHAEHLSVNLIDIRDFTTDRHRSADDFPFGGGAGMVLKPQPILDAISSVTESAPTGAGTPTVLVTAAQGRRFDQAYANELSRACHLVIICGHYEGIDARVAQLSDAVEVSIGDYVLTGGELPAMVIVDAVARLIPGVLGAAESLVEESIGSGLLEYPQYTRPADVRGVDVPSILLSGDHAAIARWRRAESLRRTFFERPDLLIHASLTRADADALARLVPLPETETGPV